MEITTSGAARRAARHAGELLQALQDFAGRRTLDEIVIRFPRGFLRTAAQHRARFAFVGDPTLRSNLAYTMILADTVSWLLLRTDIAATAREMLVKLYLFLGGTLVESITKDYLRGRCGKGFKERTQYLCSCDAITSQLKADLDWVWDMRNRMHLFLLEETEFETGYDRETQARCRSAVGELLETLNSRGRLGA